MVLLPKTERETDTVLTTPEIGPREDLGQTAVETALTGPALLGPFAQEVLGSPWFAGEEFPPPPGKISGWQTYP